MAVIKAIASGFVNANDRLINLRRLSGNQVALDPVRNANENVTRKS